MKSEQIADLANEAANETIRHIQDKLGIESGDFAGLYFSGGDNWNVLTTILFDYIWAEISEGKQWLTENHFLVFIFRGSMIIWR